MGLQSFLPFPYLLSHVLHMSFILREADGIFNIWFPFSSLILNIWSKSVTILILLFFRNFKYGFNRFSPFIIIFRHDLFMISILNHWGKQMTRLMSLSFTDFIYDVNRFTTFILFFSYSRLTYDFYFKGGRWNFDILNIPFLHQLQMNGLNRWLIWYPSSSLCSNMLSIISLLSLSSLFTIYLCFLFRVFPRWACPGRWRAGVMTTSHSHPRRRGITCFRPFFIPGYDAKRLQ